MARLRLLRRTRPSICPVKHIDGRVKTQFVIISSIEALAADAVHPKTKTAHFDEPFNAQHTEFIGAPEEIRTPDPQIRSMFVTKFGPPLTARDGPDDLPSPHRGMQPGRIAARVDPRSPPVAADRPGGLWGETGGTVSHFPPLTLFD